MVIGNIEERIRKMKDAIVSEAKQRAQHLAEEADNQADIERNNIIAAEKDKIDKEFHLRLKQEQVRHKIQKSSASNRQRIIRMEVRHNLLNDLKAIVVRELTKMLQDKALFRKIMGQLIVQGMLRMLERNIFVEVRPEHKDAVEQILVHCEGEFTKITGAETGKSMQTKLELSSYNLEKQHKAIIGGVFMRSQDGSILCNNSLDARIELVFEHLQPNIRQMLFG